MYFFNSTSSSNTFDDPVSIAKKLFDDMIEDCEDFTLLTNDGDYLNRLTGRTNSYYWLNEADKQMTTYEQLKKGIMETLDYIERCVGKEYYGCGGRKGLFDEAFDMADEAQKRYDEYCHQRAGSDECPS